MADAGKKIASDQKPVYSAWAIVAATSVFAWLAVCGSIPLIFACFGGISRNPYEPSNAVFLMLFVALFFLLTVPLLAIGVGSGLIALIRIKRSKSRLRGRALAWVGLAPLLLIAGAIPVLFVGELVSGDSKSPFRRYRVMRKQMEKARESGDQAAIDRLHIPYGLLQFENEMEYFDSAAGRYHFLNGSYPAKLVPDLEPPELGLKIALDLPHDPFGEIQSYTLEYYAPWGGWVVRDPDAPKGSRYHRFGAGKIHTDIDRLENDERFEPRERPFYRYAAKRDRYIALSRGPDGDWDFSDMELDRLLKNPADPVGVERRYDPTNGQFSGGDLYHIQDYPPG